MASVTRVPATAADRVSGQRWQADVGPYPAIQVDRHHPGGSGRPVRRRSRHLHRGQPAVVPRGGQAEDREGARTSWWPSAGRRGSGARTSSGRRAGVAAPTWSSRSLLAGQRPAGDEAEVRRSTSGTGSRSITSTTRSAASWKAGCGARDKLKKIVAHEGFREARGWEIRVRAGQRARTTHLTILGRDGRPFDPTPSWTDCLTCEPHASAERYAAKLRELGIEPD